MVLTSSAFIVSTAWWGNVDVSRFRSSFSDTEICLRSLGCLNDWEKSFKVVTVFGLSIFLPNHGQNNWDKP